jgi:hypothetical protein
VSTPAERTVAREEQAMTDAPDDSGESAGGSDAGAAFDEDELLEQAKQAFHNLYLLSLDDDLLNEVTREFGLDDRLVMATRVRQMANAPVRSVYKLHAVASALNRKPDLETDLLADAMGSAIEDRGGFIDGLRRFAESARHTSGQPDAGRLTPARWVQFLVDVGLQHETEPDGGQGDDGGPEEDEHEGTTP